MVEKKSKAYFMISENYVKFKFQSPQIRFYENTATPIRLHIIYSRLHAKAAQLGSCNRDCMAQKTPKYLLSDPLQKIFTHPCSRLLINVMHVPLQCWVISPMEAQAPVMSSPYHLAGVLDRAGGQPLLPDNLFSLPEKPRALS